MKLADDTLLMMIDIFRRGILEGMDVSQLLRDLDLIQDADGKLGLKTTAWKSTAETD